ncbi:hypothetical protein [Allosphingosinicella sp.]|uniref:hypothetical protein n=1 Tax=Allosphingosinicella sp. TaxID=2823234 RepID=UPI0037848E5E
MLLAAFLFLAGIVLTLLGKVFGFTLADVDRWLNSHSNWFTAVGDITIRLVCFFVLVCCVVVVIAAVHGLVRPAREADLGAAHPDSQVQAGGGPGRREAAGDRVRVGGAAGGVFRVCGDVRVLLSPSATAPLCRDVDQAPLRGPVGRPPRGSTPRLRFAAQILACARRCSARYRASAASAFTPSLPA